MPPEHVDFTFLDEDDDSGNCYYSSNSGNDNLGVAIPSYEEAVKQKAFYPPPPSYQQVEELYVSRISKEL